jgi:hypothetical protein
VRDEFKRQRKIYWLHKRMQVAAELQRGFMVAYRKSVELNRDAWKDAKEQADRRLRFIEGINHTCPNCGTKTVEVNPTKDYIGRCCICDMEFSFFALEEMRRRGNLDIGITRRMESLQSELSRVNETLRRAVNSVCTCGGGSPEDGCPACKVWHLMEAKP